MPASPKLDPQVLTPQAQRILSVLRTNGGWMTRSDLSDELGRPKKLHKWDIALLNMLVEHGLVQAEKRHWGGVSGIVYAYKAVVTDSD